MNEEEKKAIKVLKINPEIIADLDEELLYKMFEFEGQSIKELKKWAYKIVLNLITKLQKENEELKSDNLEKERVLEIFDNRKYRKRYLKERRKEEPNLLYPDGDEIYKRYYELKKQIDLMAEELQTHMFVVSVGKTIIGKKGIKEYYEQKATNDV